MKKIIYLLSALTAVTVAQTASAAKIKVTIDNLAPPGGVYLTPVWVGFQNGSFDIYNGGLSSQPGLERLAEDGIVDQISSDFEQNFTYIDNSSGTPVSATVLATAQTAGLPQTGTRVQGTLGTAPIGPGGTVSQEFNVSTDGSNNYFSYASMILSSNDYFVANALPTAHDISSLFSNPSEPISFNIGSADMGRPVNDAGTEVNNFNTSAGNDFFPGLPEGQTQPNEGADENGVVEIVSDAYSDFLNTPPGFDFTNLNFNDYPNGVARVTIATVVPEPGTSLVGLLIVSGLGMIACKRRGNF